MYEVFFTFYWSSIDCWYSDVFNISSQFSSLVAICLRFYVFILFCTIFLLVPFLLLLVLLFYLSSWIVLIVQKGSFVRFVELTQLCISLSCLLVYECFILGLIVFWIRLYLVASNWGAVVETSVGDNSIRLEKHFLVKKIRKIHLAACNGLFQYLRVLWWVLRSVFQSV